MNLLPRWLQPLWKNLTVRGRRWKRHRPAGLYRRPMFEVLEDRLAPATFAVGPDLSIRLLDHVGDSPAGVHSVVFFESTVADFRVLRDGLAEGVDAVILDANADGVRAMAAFLAQRHDLTAIHIVAHGSSGAISLGAANLNQHTLGNYAAQLDAIGNALASNGEVALWSCNVAQGEQGQAFIGALASAIDAGVAAASYQVGAPAQGGRWQLDVHASGARGAVPFAAEASERFHSTLDAGTGVVTYAASMNTPRQLHTATLLNDGRVLVAGGNFGIDDSTGFWLDSAEIYDPSSNTWTPVASMASARTFPRATLLSDGRVLVAGQSGPAHGVSAEIYDPVSNSWSFAGSLSSQEEPETLTLLDNGKVLALKSRLAFDGGFHFVPTAELYDPATNTWSLATQPTGQRGYTATKLDDGRVFVTGSYAVNFSDLLSAEIYDPVTDTWSMAATPPTARNGAPAVKLADGRVLWIGGRSGGISNVYQYSADLYDPATDSWSSAGTLLSEHEYGATSVLLPNGNVLLSGIDLNGLNTAEQEVYDPASNTWSAASPPRHYRLYHTATVLNNGEVLLAGAGWISSSSVELYDPAPSLVVTNTNDYGRGSLRSAMLYANVHAGHDIIAFNLAAPSPHTIRLVRSTYYSAYDLVEIESGALPDIVESVSIVGPGRDLLTIDASDTYYSVLNVDDNFPSYPGQVIPPHDGTLTNADVRISGLTLANHAHSAANTVIYNRERLTLDDVAFVNNVSNVFGGAAIYNEVGILDIRNSVFTYNHAVPDLYLGMAGGAIFSEGGIVTIRDSQFLDNQAAIGGAIFITPDRGNHPYGFASPNPAQPDVRIERTTFRSNVASDYDAGGAGGAIYNFGGTLAILGSTFESNRTVLLGLSGNEFEPNLRGGGAIFNQGPATILNSTFGNNQSAHQGGAIYNVAAAAILNSTFSWNVAALGGGAIANLGSLTAVNGTVALNRIISADASAALGGGIYNEGSATLHNTIVAWNGWDTLQRIYGSSDLAGSLDPVSQNNLITDPANAGGLSHGVNGNIVGTDDGAGGRSQLPLEQVMEVFTNDNGGPTWTQALVPASKARNAGSNQRALEFGLQTDQRGLNRFVHQTVDIGAYELQSKVTITLTGSSGTEAIEQTQRFGWLVTNWTPTATAPDGRYSYPTVLLKDGRVLAVGGQMHSSSYQIFDPLTDSWSSARPMPTSRSGHTATLLNDGRVLVGGGAGYLASAEIYDPVTDTWSSAGSLATERTGHTATLLGDGRVLIVGGTNFISGPTDSGGFLRSAEIYDPATNTWMTAASTSDPRFQYSATLLADGRVLVAGGSGGFDGGDRSLASAEVYDPISDTWSPAGSMISARELHTATLLDNGKVLVAGGFQDVPGSMPFSNLSLASAEIYDPVTNTWSVAASFANRRYGHTATLINGMVLVSGGQKITAWDVDRGSDPSKAEMYDPVSNTWLDAGVPNYYQWTQASVAMGSGTALIAGGVSELFDDPGPTTITIAKNGTPIYNGAATFGNFNFDAFGTGTYVIDVVNADGVTASRTVVVTGTDPDVPPDDPPAVPDFGPSPPTVLPPPASVVNPPGKGAGTPDAATPPEAPVADSAASSATSDFLALGVYLLTSLATAKGISVVSNYGSPEDADSSASTVTPPPIPPWEVSSALRGSDSSGLLEENASRSPLLQALTNPLEIVYNGTLGGDSVHLVIALRTQAEIKEPDSEATVATEEPEETPRLSFCGWVALTLAALGIPVSWWSWHVRQQREEANLRRNHHV